MSTKELILVLIIPVLVFLGIKAVNTFRSNVFDKKTKAFLIYLTVLCPPIGYLVSLRYKKAVN
jgi:hypothetical protein